MIVLTNVYKHYCVGSEQIPILSDINLKIEFEEFSAIMGPSGSGKSTLMNILGLLDKPSRGQYLFMGQALGELSDQNKAKLRNQTIGFVFQSFMLLPRLNLIENISLPLVYQNFTTKQMVYESRKMLERVGLLNFAERKPSELSGGQQQRVAIARALVTRPKIIFADEPTGALDSQTGQEVLALLKDLNKTQQTTIIIVTHDLEIAKQCARIITLQDGKLVNNQNGVAESETIP
jgi:putative ABC transport system ATP-binding protein